MGANTLKERICSLRSKFFPLRVDPVFKVLNCPGIKQNSQKLFPFMKVAENVEMHLCLFKSKDSYFMLYCGYVHWHLKKYHIAERLA